MSYVADDICESACSERQKKCGEELGQHVVFFSANTKKLLRMLSRFLLRDVKGNGLENVAPLKQDYLKYLC